MFLQKKEKEKEKKVPLNKILVGAHIIVYK